MSFIHSRTFIGVALFLSFLVLLVTSVLLYTQQHSDLVALLHTLLGFVMVIVVIWHLVKNKVPLLNYLNPLKQVQGRPNFALPLALCLIAYLGFSPFLKLAPAVQVYEIGQTLKAQDKVAQDNKMSFVIRNNDVLHATGQSISIELTKGPYFLWPQYAIWLETMEGEFVQPIYVTSKLGTNSFTNKVEKRDPNQVFTTHLMTGENPIAATALIGALDPETKDSRMRPESLPVFYINWVYKLKMAILCQRRVALK